MTILPLLASLAAMSPTSCPQEALLTVDLNGDGKPEIVRFECDDDGVYKLSVGSKEVRGELPAFGGSCKIQAIDLDRSDRFKELQLHTDGPSDDPADHLYRWDGQTLILMAELTGWLRVPGNGIVYTDAHRGFWTQTDKYVVNAKTHRLDTIRPEMYFMQSGVLEAEDEEVPGPVRGTVSRGFPIYCERNRTRPLATLAEGSRIQVLAFAPTTGVFNNLYEQKGWYLVRSQTGLLGWAHADELIERVHDLPFAG